MRGGWFLGDCFPTGCRILTESDGGLLQSRIPLIGSVVPNLVPALVDGDDRQQGPQVIPTGDVDLAVALSAEETLKRGLNNVFGRHLSLDVRVQAATRQTDQ